MVTDLIRQRKSVRIFDGKSLSAEDRSALAAYAASLTNPFSVPITFRLLDTKEYGLSSPVIVGADTYLAAKVEKVPNFELAHFDMTLEEAGVKGSYCFSDPGISAPENTHYIVTYRRA